MRYLRHIKGLGLYEMVCYIIMTNTTKQNFLNQLKQSMVEKELSHKFNNILLTSNTKISKETAIPVQSLPQGTALLPSISNTKIGLRTRVKSHSAKKIGMRTSSLEGSSQKQLFKKTNEQSSSKKQLRSNSKVGIEGLVAKKQILTDTSAKHFSSRGKMMTMRTPVKPRETRVNDFLEMRNTQNPGGYSTKRVDYERKLREFSEKMEGSNIDFWVTVKATGIEEQGHKKIDKVLKRCNSQSLESARILVLVEKVENFIRKHKIETGNIDFARLVALSPKISVSNFELLNLFVNKAQIQAKTKIIGLEYYTVPESKGFNLAACKITSIFKMVYSKKFYSRFRTLLSKVTTIQRIWRNCLLAKRTRKNMAEAASAKIQKSKELNASLTKNWSLIKCAPRFEVHICSYSLQEFKRLTMLHLRQRQNNQISRIFRATQIDTHIIYVLPYSLEEQVIRYYKSVFGLHGGNAFDKVFFIVPENVKKLQEYGQLTTTSLLLYSPKALKRISQIVGKNYGYIVPSFPSVEYVNLSAELGLPVLAPPQNMAKLLSTKSGCLQVFRPITLKENCLFQLPVSVSSIFSEKELINTLALLIFHHKDVKMWYFKIEDEVHSRGVAYLPINKIAFLRELCEGDGDFEGIEEKQMVKLIADELRAKLRIRLKIVNKQIYPNYDQYISHFLTRGGKLEAGVPQRHTQFTVSFFIDPIGDFNLLSTYNKLELGGKSICQAIKFPSSLSVDYQTITRHLYKEIWTKQRHFGYFSADFMFSQQTQSCFAIGLDCFLNEKTSALFMMKYCGRSCYNKDANSIIGVNQEEQHAIYCPILSLSKVSTTASFFKNCKFGGISFDLERKLGTVFTLLTGVQEGQIGFGCLQNSQFRVIQELKRAVDYFSHHHREQKSSNDEVGLLKGIAVTWLKRLEKQNVKKIDHWV